MIRGMVYGIAMPTLVGLLEAFPCQKPWDAVQVGQSHDFVPEVSLRLTRGTAENDDNLWLFNV